MSENNYYHRNGCFIPKSDFFNGCQIESNRRGLSKVETNIHSHDELGAAWCMRYVHTANRPGIDWVTECGIRIKNDSDDVVFSVMLTTTTNAEYRLSTDSETNWDVSVPRFVREVAHHCLVGSISISGVRIPLAASLPDERQREKFVRPWMNWVKSEEEAKVVVDIINNARRRFAVVLVMGESALAKEEVRELSTKLCGKSYVCLINADWKAAQLFKAYEVPFDRVRVVLPFYTRKQDRLSRHPIYTLSDDLSHKRDRDRVIESQTGYVTLFEEGAIYQLKDVVALNRLSDFNKKRKAVEQAILAKNLSDKDAQEMLDYAQSIQLDYEAQKKRANEAEKDRDEWRSRVRETEDESRRKLDAQKAIYEGQLRRRHASFAVPENVPMKTADLRQWSAALTNLSIYDGAWEGMRDRDKADKVALAWNMLWHLNVTMHKIVFEENGVSEPRTTFKERSSYTYTADENDDVKAKWPEGHKAIIDGETFMCWRHIKRGNDDKELVRIYFEFDRNRNRIIVSWIGKHLRTNLSAAQ